ncbi:NAD-dependent DNA ligase [Chrysochromulina parva virus BQ2]|uniref:NAD-dependent DNA ligase n=1 Tax=Chrysochromulina parva virus BQ2 TaxID=3070831 RepID=A0A4Y6GT34_9VIRU|nr:NAD-dependent DNA ligase [Chrysochromulina parva virus]QDF45936.1 NAD-dependent DNA ligase [Chrysochromulina parva virus BQ2]
MSIASCNIAVNSSNDSISNDDIPCVLNLFRFSNISLLIFFVYFFNVLAVALGIFTFIVSFLLVFFGGIGGAGSGSCSGSGSGSGSGSCSWGAGSGSGSGSCSCSWGAVSCICILFLISSKGKVKTIDCSFIRSCGSLYSICKKSKISFSVLNRRETSFSCFIFVSF